jgi:Flp pilus assembly protein TadD
VSGTVALAILACGATPGTGVGASEVAPGALPDEPARIVPRASALVQQGEQRLAAEDAVGARSLFERAIAEDPNDPRAHFDLGISLEMLGDLESAERQYRKATEIQSDFAEALNNLGVLLRRKGELDAAVAILRKAVSANPRSAPGHLNLALALEDGGDSRGAVSEYRRALRLDPSNAMTRANLGLLLLRTGDPEAAARELDTARANARGNRAALVAIGNGLRRAGHASAAVDAMKAAIRAGDGRPTPAMLSELALAYRAAGNRDAAMASLREAMALKKDYAIAYYLLANMLAAAGDYAEAARHYRRYLKLEPDGPQSEKARERARKVQQALREDK